MMEGNGTAVPGPLNGAFSFRTNPDGTVNKSTVLCVFCNKEFSFHRSTSSLKYHLNAKHFIVKQEVQDYTAHYATANSQARLELSQNTLDQTSTRRRSRYTSDQLTNCIAKWIAMDCRPVSVVEDRGLAEVLQVASTKADYRPPSRSTIVSKIQQLYDTEKTTQLVVVAGAEYTALIGDQWTSASNHTHLGVTAHFIDSEWNRQAVVLTVRETVVDACTDVFLSVAEEWGVQHITTVCTDGSLNMHDSMDAASKRLPRYEHLPCTAHMLHRSITACLADSGFSDPLLKCRRIVHHFKHSPANTEELQQHQAQLWQQKEHLIQDVPTRWNSTLAMISCLLKNQDAIIATLNQQKHKLDMLTASDWDKLKRLETLLEPCRYVTELLGGETYVSCSVVLPALCHLYRTMEASQEDPAFVERFKTAFKKDLSEQQTNINNRWLRIASALDPRFKDLKFLPKGEREEVWTRLEVLLQEESSRTNLKQEEPAKKRSLLLLASDSDSDDDMMGLNGPLNRYKAEPNICMEACPLQWWSTHAGAHQELSVLARKYLASPATSVPCERLFSVKGSTVQKKREALDSENVDQIYCLSNWLRDE
ncbi:E3 SUMO-protein ligase ZBED1 [Astyanax mexicanus]|uniref:E3 SUMO-protein ligase ZBED1 n=1 Tax=Astyanax mexicanus TaxID=7994 RepID=UPI0020CB22DF|nr:E3 SUMO-protein ligase ZBED1 [Astyanax mexicanus]